MGQLIWHPYHRFFCYFSIKRTFANKVFELISSYSKRSHAGVSLIDTAHLNSAFNCLFRQRIICLELHQLWNYPFFCGCAEWENTALYFTLRVIIWYYALIKIRFSSNASNSIKPLLQFLSHNFFINSRNYLFCSNYCVLLVFAWSC